MSPLFKIVVFAVLSILRGKTTTLRGILKEQIVRVHSAICLFSPQQDSWAGSLWKSGIGAISES